MQRAAWSRAQLYQSQRICNVGHLCDSIDSCPTRRLLFAERAADCESCRYFDVKLSVDPFSEQGIAWAKAVQEAFPSSECPGCPVINYYLLDGSQDM